MPISGIIAEFNPFHRGHQHLLDQADGLKIIALSGNFVQRGEPAIIDKWTRTQMALEGGADLVVELPFLVAVQSADYFAHGAVTILNRLGVDRLTFGTEEELDYQSLSTCYHDYGRQMESFLQNLPASLTYPQKSQKMWERFAGVPFSNTTPNHILGLAYAKACSEYSIRLCPVKRLGAGFHSEDKTVSIASATAIRKHRKDASFISQAMPQPDLFRRSPQVTWDDYFPLLRYQLITHPNLESILQVNAELASRLRSAIQQATSVDDLVDRVLTKRYTRARLRRLLTYILVNASQSTIPEAVRVLGFSRKGQQHLASLRGQVPIVTKIGQEPWDGLSQRADQIYQLGHPDLAEQTYGRSPIRINLD